MKIEEFKYQKKEIKMQLVFDNGIYLCSRQEPEYTIDLYQIDAFYVEAYYHHREKVSGYMRAFSSVHDLEPYLDEIDLSGLMQWEKLQASSCKTVHSNFFFYTITFFI